ncbi:MAG: hypothetical protein ABMA64_01945 [Myxococcota bacterium]
MSDPAGRRTPSCAVLAWLAAAGCLSDLPDLSDPCAPWPDPGMFRVSIDEPNEPNRRPYVYVPGTEGPREVVVLLHGGGMSGPKIAEVTGYQTKAEQEGFVLVYPNGLGWPIRHWNAGPGFGDTDDVKFLDDLLAEILPKVCGDRVLATGFSNGAMMAHRWACETEGFVDVVGVSSGPLLLDQCDGPPMPMRHYHGVLDPIVPIEGGEGHGEVYPGVEEMAAVWRKRNLCADGEPEFREDGDTTCASWDCAAPTEVCLIDGWRHMWPGGIHAAETEADATDALWDFFLEHRSSDALRSRQASAD